MLSAGRTLPLGGWVWGLWAGPPLPLRLVKRSLGLALRLSLQDRAALCPGGVCLCPPSSLLSGWGFFVGGVSDHSPPTSSVGWGAQHPRIFPYSPVGGGVGKSWQEKSSALPPQSNGKINQGHAPVPTLPRKVAGCYSAAPASRTRPLRHREAQFFGLNGLTGPLELVGAGQDFQQPHMDCGVRV